jgi:hypothetical protein
MKKSLSGMFEVSLTKDTLLSGPQKKKPLRSELLPYRASFEKTVARLSRDSYAVKLVLQCKGIA